MQSDTGAANRPVCKNSQFDLLHKPLNWKPQSTLLWDNAYSISYTYFFPRSQEIICNKKKTQGSYFSYCVYKNQSYPTVLLHRYCLDLSQNGEDTTPYSYSGREKKSKTLLQALLTVLSCLNSAAFYGAVTFYHAFNRFYSCSHLQKCG